MDPLAAHHLPASGDQQFRNLQAIIELQMPVGAERADLVLIGGTQEQPRGYILETKQWSSATLEPESCEVDVEGFGLHQHPVAQVLNYQGKLSPFNARAAGYEFASGAYLHNLGTQGIAQLLQECNDALPRTVQLFGVHDGQALAHSVATHLVPSTTQPDEHELLTGAAYGQSALLFDVLARHSKAIADRVVATLAEAGVYLKEDQELLLEQALKAARRRKEEVFLVQGGPGSGNNRLQAILRKCFDIAFPGGSGVLMFFEVPGHGTGIGDQAFEGTFDLGTCDEAQRMREASMSTVLSRAPTSVIFMDETQRLNPREQGTVYNFSSAAGRAGRTVRENRLPAVVRCRGGKPYHDFVEAAMRDPFELISLGDQPWTDSYSFQVCENAQDILALLVNKRKTDASKRVALVASLTESPGSIGRVGDPENVRVGYPLSSGFDLYKEAGLELRWLMKPSEYIAYWMRGKSNELQRTASIYGAQGFEADFVGVVWGRDLVVRGRQMGPRPGRILLRHNRWPCLPKARWHG